MNAALIRQLHRGLRRWSFYPLALSSLIAVGLYAGRVWLTHSLGFHFLIWNLFLAWLPYWFSLWAVHADRERGGWWRALLPATLWLLFFPNAPYIITDLVHFNRQHSFAWWYDAGLIMALAWSGCMLGVVSLYAMQGLVRRHLGALASWLFVFASLLLGGLGVYMGRFLRWNSWDALLAPHSVLADVLERVANPRSYPSVYGMPLMLSGMLLALYVMLLYGRPSLERDNAG